jgi:hypothetical protein
VYWDGSRSSWCVPAVAGAHVAARVRASCVRACGVCCVFTVTHVCAPAVTLSRKDRVGSATTGLNPRVLNFGDVRVGGTVMLVVTLHNHTPQSAFYQFQVRRRRSRWARWIVNACCCCCCCCCCCGVLSVMSVARSVVPCRWSPAACSRSLTCKARCWVCSTRTSGLRSRPSLLATTTAVRSASCATPSRCSWTSSAQVRASFSSYSLLDMCSRVRLRGDAPVANVVHTCRRGGTAYDDAHRPASLKSKHVMAYRNWSSEMKRMTPGERHHRAAVASCAHAACRVVLCLAS